MLAERAASIRAITEALAQALDSATPPHAAAQVLPVSAARVLPVPAAAGAGEEDEGTKSGASEGDGGGDGQGLGSEGGRERHDSDAVGGSRPDFACIEKERGGDRLRGAAESFILALWEAADSREEEGGGAPPCSLDLDPRTLHPAPCTLNPRP